MKPYLEAVDSQQVSTGANGCERVQRVSTGALVTSAKLKLTTGVNGCQGVELVSTGVNGCNRCNGCQRAQWVSTGAPAELASPNMQIVSSTQNLGISGASCIRHFFNGH